jgi:hypothetical protein
VLILEVPHHLMGPQVLTLSPRPGGKALHMAPRTHPGEGSKAIIHTVKGFLGFNILKNCCAKHR